MNGNDQEFQEWLLATFREDADDLLTDISQGLIELERSGGSGDIKIIEQIYRKTHSLKGASRAVNFREIESICKNLENIFSQMKNGDFTPDDLVYDLFHSAIRGIRELLFSENKTEYGFDKIIDDLESLLKDKKYKRQSKVNKNVRVQKKQTENPVAGGSGINLPNREGNKSNTIKISANKLDRLIMGADDLLTTRLFITHRMHELEEMISRFSIWRWNHSLINNDVHLIREILLGKEKTFLPPELVVPIERLIAYLKYDRDFIINLQHDLNAHFRATDVDRSALELSTTGISELIHDAVLSPISSIFSSSPAFVREYSRSLGKQADIVIEGDEIEIDRRILENLKAPLMHLISNCMDHGIEYPDIREAHGKKSKGLIRISIIPQSGSKVRIEVKDDGSGIEINRIRKTALKRGIITEKEEERITDEEVIWLIFRSGFSTNSEIADLSGRGLGLAIVEETVTRLNGEITISSNQGVGTSIVLIVPVRLATLKGVIVNSRDYLYVFPLQHVRQVIRIKPDSIFLKGTRHYINIEGEIIRIISLEEILKLPDYEYTYNAEEQISVLIISYGAGQVACIVDNVFRVQEIVVRSLGTQLKRVKKISGAVILGDGKIALVLDPLEIIQDSLKVRNSEIRKVFTHKNHGRILVVEDSVTSRALLHRTLENAGYYVETAEDGIEGYEKLRNREFDLVVSDVDMPRMDGFTLTEKIRADERLFNTPVILVTSLDSKEDKEHGISVGADAYLVKSSYDKNNLLDTIMNLQKVSH